MLRFARAGNTVTVHSLDRLARNLVDLRRIVSDLTGRGVRVEFVKEQLSFTGEDNAMAQLLLSVMGAFAEFERSLIRERQREGVELAKARGAYRGRKRTLNNERIAELRQRAAAEEQGHVGAGVRHQPRDRVPVPAGRDRSRRWLISPGSPTTRGGRCGVVGDHGSPVTGRDGATGEGSYAETRPRPPDPRLRLARGKPRLGVPLGRQCFPGGPLAWWWVTWRARRRRCGWRCRWCRSCWPVPVPGRWW